jgi:CubicO group peptidase (beta-lactamase class C family)
VFIAVGAWGAELTNAPTFDIPRMRGITVDGSGQDWDNRGFQVDMMTDKLQRVQPLDDLTPTFRLGWDDEGLLLLVQVHDDAWAEQKEEINIWDGDSLEIFVVKERGTKEMMQIVVGPGVTPGQPGLRTRLLGFQLGGVPEGAHIEAARVADAGYYSFEMRFPWENLGITPKRGVELGFQIFVNDVDTESGRFQAIWYPMTRTHEHSDRTHRIVLAKKASGPIQAAVSGDYADWAQPQVKVRTLGSLTGREVTILEGRRVLAQAQLKPLGADHAGADLTIPLPPNGEDFQPLDVRIDRQRVGTLYLPDARIQRGKALMVAPIGLEEYVFSGNFLPGGGFSTPMLGQALIGDHEVEVSYYDADGNPVTAAENVGRYGAVIDIKPATGPTIRRYRTVFRAPDGFSGINWWDYRPEANLALPYALELSPDAIEAHDPSIRFFLKRSFEQALDNDMNASALLAALHEYDGGSEPVTRANDAQAEDRQWWVEQKRRMNGMAEAYPNPFVCPRPVDGVPAPVLREGTVEEAGMQPGVVEALDAVCQAWWEASGEPFAACVAHNGVVFYHKAYGTRYGEPMTVTTKSWMASITKLLSGTLMMTLVDQGLVYLDAPIDRYLPALRGIEVETSLTPRHLYTHTNGLLLGLQPPNYYGDHWGDEYPDLEHIVAEFYPYLKVGEEHGYNGVGYALGGKIIESVSGEAIPQFFDNHLLAPLGCENTEAVDTSARAFSVPMDIAKIGQMLLNRGRYGDMEFFSEETFEKMMPRPLTDILGPDTDLKWGIGTVFMPDPGLSQGTFGHGAASGATLRIDPENNLVVVMTRNATGQDYSVYHPQFTQAIGDHLPGAQKK